MTQGRGNGGRTGIAGSASVEMEKVSTGENVPLPADDEGLLIAKIFGSDNSGTDQELSVASSGELRVQGLKNQTGIISGQNTGGGSLASNTIPRGRTVRVQALTGNSAPVEVDGSFELVAGQAVDLAVTNTDQISYTVSNSGDGVCFIVEG